MRSRADLGSLPTRIVDNLEGMQLDATERLEEVWGDVQRYVAELLAWVGVEGIEAEELSVIPGLDEVFSLGDIRTAAASGRYDVIVVDCGPTAETIRFLSLPEILSWYIERVVPIEKRVDRRAASRAAHRHEPADRRRLRLRCRHALLRSTRRCARVADRRRTRQRARWS